MVSKEVVILTVSGEYLKETVQKAEESVVQIGFCNIIKADVTGSDADGWRVELTAT